MAVVIETERLVLREFVPEDAEALLALNADPAATRYTADGPLRDAEHAREFLLAHPIADYAKHGFGRWACVPRGEEGRLIGLAGLKYLEEFGEVDVGYRLLPAYWGRGLATEAARAAVDYGFARLGLGHVVGLVMPENVASVRVLEKLGMRPTGPVECRSHPAVRYVVTADEYRRG